jgi:putative transposase
VAFIDANRDDVVEGSRLGVEPIFKVLREAGLQVALSSYYATKSRRPSPRSQRDAELRPVLRQLWEDNYRVYGARKLWKAARRASYDVGRDQVAGLMRAEGIEGFAARSGSAPPAPSWEQRAIPTWSVATSRRPRPTNCG